MHPLYFNNKWIQKNFFIKCIGLKDLFLIEKYFTKVLKFHFRDNH